MPFILNWRHKKKQKEHYVDVLYFAIQQISVYLCHSLSENNPLWAVNLFIKKDLFQLKIIFSIHLQNLFECLNVIQSLFYLKINPLKFSNICALWRSIGTASTAESHYHNVSQCLNIHFDVNWSLFAYPYLNECFVHTACCQTRFLLTSFRAKLHSYDNPDKWFSWTRTCQMSTWHSKTYTLWNWKLYALTVREKLMSHCKFC